MSLPADILVEFFVNGQSSPLDAWGTFQGKRWDFWAKHGAWEFRLSEDPEVLPELMGPEHKGLFRNGVYGNPKHRFDSMTSDEAEKTIEACIAEYRETLER